ncbi:MAG: ROK family protein [Thermomicrobiales bacterium]
MQSIHPYHGANHRIVKQRNRAMIFQAIRALGPVARADLARRTGLNAATITNIVDELLAAELVHETGQGLSRIGRKPISLEVNPSARLTVGIDLARAAITGGIVDLSGTIVDSINEPAGPWLSSEIIFSTVEGVIERLLRRLTSAERAAVVGIGIGAPGPLSIRSGRFLGPPSFGMWDDLALQAAVEERFHLPTRVDNNGNTSALAELWFGAGQGVENFVLLNLGTGVGAGLVLDGDLYRGDHDLAGELGHLSINADGPRCACGNYGCLEMYVSVPRVLAAVHAALATGEPSALRAMRDAHGNVSTALLIAAARSGDPLAVRVFADTAHALAAGIASIIHAFDPQMILIGRELAQAGEVLLAPVRAEVQRRVFPALQESVCIEVAALPDAPVIGAATLALREFFHAPLADRGAVVA